jgi:hypothetical protein
VAVDNSDGRVRALEHAGPVTERAIGQRDIGPSPPGWEVPGYDVVELLGFGASGEVWLARESASGEPVALKRLRTPRDLTARDRLRREAAALSCVDHPHVVRLRTVVGAGDDLVLVLDHASGGSLAGLLGTRRLRAGEIVTIAVPLAGALAAVHARGLVHGDVTPANVLFTADGRPLLSDLGVCRLVGERLDPAGVVAGTPGFLDPAVLAGEQPGPAADVHGLAAVCFAALTGRPPYDEAGGRRPLLTDAGSALPPALVAVIESALDPDPHRRPSADEVALAVFESCAAEPVHLPAGREPGRGHESAPALTHDLRVRPLPPAEPAVSAPTRRRRHGRGRRPVRRLVQALRAVPVRPAVGLLLVLCGVSMAVLTGVVWAGSNGRGSAAAVGPTNRPAAEPATSVDWSAVLATLDQARSAAFAEADADALAAVDAAGSPARTRDTELLDQLRASGFTARGVRLVPTSVEVMESADRRTVLRVVDVMPPYELVDADSAESNTRPGRGSARWMVTLVRDGPAWRVFDVQRA